MNSLAFRKSDRFKDTPSSPAHVIDAGSLEFGKTQLDPLALDLLDDAVMVADAYIVISSSWRHAYKLEEIKQMFEACGFMATDRVIDRTGTDPSGNRGKEIQTWIDIHRERRVVQPELEPITGYCIVDDSDDFTAEQHDHFVKTDDKVGLTEDDADKMISILEGD